VSNRGLPPVVTPPRSPLMQAVNTIISFVVGGPLFGGVVAYGVLAIYWNFTGGLPPVAMRFYDVMFENMWSVYLAGLVPAVVLGLLVALVDDRFGGTPFILAAAFGLAVGLLWVLLAGDALDDLLRATVVIVCLSSTLVCWHMRLQEDD
jgi:hypothetical protein